MMYKISSLLLVAAFFSLIPFVQGQTSNVKYTSNRAKEKIIIEVQLSSDNLKDGSLNIEFYPVETIGVGQWNAIKQKIRNGNVKWDIDTATPIYIYTGAFLKGKNSYWLVEPNDSVIISCCTKRLLFYGQGAEKFRLQNEIQTIKDSLKRYLSNPVDYNTKSIEDYLEWNNYLNKQLELLIPLIDSYKDSISPFTYNYIRDLTLDNIIDDRSDKCATFLGYAKKSGMSLQSICDIFDSTYAANVTKQTLPSLSGIFFGSWAFIRLQAARAVNFHPDSLRIETKRTLLYYERGLKTYKGLAREKFLLDFLTKELIHDLGFIPETETTLSKYYSEPGYPEYKKYVKNYEVKARVLRDGQIAPDFSLSDINGRPFNKDYLKGKIAIIDFWFTGCVGCMQLTPVIQKIEESFKNDSNIVFLSVSVDKNKEMWMKSIEGKKYTTSESINLYTSGHGDNHHMVKAYNISSYPSLYLLDAYGRIVQNPLPDPRGDNGEQLIDLIREQIVLLHDGPYVIHKDTSVVIYSIYGSSVSAKESNMENLPVLKVQSDIHNKLFDIELKKNLYIEPSEFAQPQRIFALSDIEGNFDAFRTLLQANKIIDQKYNWIFGTGHLVFCGDMFDRGEQVTECLWLIYSLEEKAKAAGGYVHFILGNHEIMNLSGDFRYVKQKYIMNAQKIGRPYSEIYNANSELGKWLRTKNIIEKIGDILFVHGGISKEINDLAIPIVQMNEFARYYYGAKSISQESTDKKIFLLFGSNEKLSPFWYRSYYLDQDVKIYTSGDTLYKTPFQQVNRTLDKFKVCRIITGHTVFADTISVHYNGKVVNIDTRHAEGKSEALLVERNDYYRVNNKGEKVLLDLQSCEHISGLTQHFKK